MDKMIGKLCPTGPGGRDCACCGDAPGKARTVARRAAKRGERSAWKAAATRDLRPLYAYEDEDGDRYVSFA